MSIDQSVVDLDIPFRLGGFASTTIQLLGIVGVMTQVTWEVLLLVIPMAIACVWMQVFNYAKRILPSMHVGFPKILKLSKRSMYMGVQTK